MELMAQWEPQDRSDLRVSPDLRVRLARMELMARPDPKVRQDQQVPRARTVLTAR
jgi:hypothetical protein